MCVACGFVLASRSLLLNRDDIIRPEDRDEPIYDSGFPSALPGTALPNITESTDAAANTTTAYTLGIGQIAAGTMNVVGDVDWFKVSLTAGVTYTFAMVGTDVSNVTNPFLRLIGTDGLSSLASNANGLQNGNAVITYTPTTTGTYYLEASTENVGGFVGEQVSRTGSYRVSATTGNRALFDDEMGASIIDTDFSWSATPGAAATVSYGFRKSVPTYDEAGSNLVATFQQLTQVQMDAVRKSLALWSDVANITFTEVADAGVAYTNSATMLFANYQSTTDGAGAFAYYPGATTFTSQPGDVWLNRQYVSTTNLDLGGYSFFALTHEIGHAIGLSHPGLYNAAPGVSITYANNAQFANDSQQFSVMSYFSNSATGGTLGASPQNYTDAPMLYDIGALQNIYGVNMSTRTGATVYGFGSNAGAIYDFALNSVPAFSIWDAGGIDTINASGFSQSQTISLVPGTFSNIGGYTKNVSIAYGAIIENAVGGSGVDTITGNASANVISGGGSNDTMDGAAGNDTLNGGTGNDSVNGGGGYDRAVFDVTPGAAIIIHNTDGTKTITGGGFTDTLLGVEVAQLSDGTLVSLRERTNKADLSADGRSDILLRNSVDGSVYVWEVNGTSLGGTGSFGTTPGAAWKARGTGDFNADGRSDVLLQNSDTGQSSIWFSDGLGSAVSGASGNVGWAPGAQYVARATGDFNGDGRSDILLQDSTNGQCFIFLTNGTGVIGANFVGTPVGANWVAKATGDFNGDGKSDILFQNSNDGASYIWNIDGLNVIGNGQPGWTPGADWQVRGTGDFNRDGKSDILLQNAVNGQLFTFMVDGTTAINTGFIGPAVGANVVARGTGDFNGDGQSDILFQDAGSGTAYVWNLDGTTVTAFGQIGWVPGAPWVAFV